MTMQKHHSRSKAVITVGVRPSDAHKKTREPHDHQTRIWQNYVCVFQRHHVSGSIELQYIYILTVVQQKKL